MAVMPLSRRLLATVPATFTALVLAIMPVQAHADPGDLDRSFGERGSRVVAPASAAAEVERISGRRIVTATADATRPHKADPENAVHVQMFTPGGDPVEAFGRRGERRLGSCNEYCQISLTWMPEQRWIVVQAQRGEYDNPSSVFWALKTDGSPVMRFGNDGVAKLPRSYVDDIAAQGRKVVVLGYENPNSDARTSLVKRLMPDGTIDETFNEGTGIRTFADPGLYLYQVVHHRGDLYVSGSSDEGLEVFKLTEDGQLASEWATGGNATWAPPAPGGGPAQDYGGGFIDVRDRAGAIVLMGILYTGSIPPYGSPNYTESGAIGALTSDGVRDDTFDNRVVSGFFARGPLVALPSGKTLAPAVTWTPGTVGHRRESVARFEPAGGFDEGFGNNGIVRRDKSPDGERIARGNVLLAPVRGTIVLLEKDPGDTGGVAVLVGLQN